MIKRKYQKGKKSDPPKWEKTKKYTQSDLDSLEAQSEAYYRAANTIGSAYIDGKGWVETNAKKRDAEQSLLNERVKEASAAVVRDEIKNAEKSDMPRIMNNSNSGLKKGPTQATKFDEYGEPIKYSKGRSPKYFMNKKK